MVSYGYKQALRKLAPVDSPGTDTVTGAHHSSDNSDDSSDSIRLNELIAELSEWLPTAIEADRNLGTTVRLSDSMTISAIYVASEHKVRLAISHDDIQGFTLTHRDLMEDISECVSDALSIDADWVFNATQKRAIIVYVESDTLLDALVESD